MADLTSIKDTVSSLKSNISKQEIKNDLRRKSSNSVDDIVVCKKNIKMKVLYKHS